MAVRDAARSVVDRPGAHTFDDFIIYHGPCTRALLGQLVRARWGRVRNGIAAIRAR